jgi:hypothetical protein
MHHDLLFETSRFNLSEVKEHFINPCCFGEDLAAWLRDELLEKGLEVTAPAQEDWGWYIEANDKGSWYFIGVGGNADEAGQDRNHGEWRIMVERRRSAWKRLTGGGEVPKADAMVEAIWGILVKESDFKNPRRE